jgi:hypothetical protein
MTLASLFTVICPSWALALLRLTSACHKVQHALNCQCSQWGHGALNQQLLQLLRVLGTQLSPYAQCVLQDTPCACRMSL